MIRRSIDIIAVGVLLVGMVLAGRVHQVIHTRRLAVERILIPSRAYREFVRLKQRVPICLNRS